MTLHTIIQLAWHRLTAKRLHGVHSPFVFDFATTILATPSQLASVQAPLPLPWLPGKYRSIVARIISHYQYNTPIVTSDDLEDIPVAADVLILKSDKPGNWARIFNKYYRVRQNDCLFVVCDIHKTKRHTAKWRKLVNHPKIPMSIDLYGIGLLWFKGSFLVKQHFVLR